MLTRTTHAGCLPLVPIKVSNAAPRNVTKPIQCAMHLRVSRALRTSRVPVYSHFSHGASALLGMNDEHALHGSAISHFGINRVAGKMRPGAITRSSSWPRALPSPESKQYSTSFGANEQDGPIREEDARRGTKNGGAKVLHARPMPTIQSGNIRVCVRSGSGFLHHALGFLTSKGWRL